MTVTIPIVPFAPFLNGNTLDRKVVARQVYEAFSAVGFVYLSDHGVTASSIETAFNESRRFFCLPLEQKLSYRLQDASVNQGYTADGAEGVNEHKECYEHRRFHNPSCPTTEILPGFRERLDTFYNECTQLALEVLRCFAIILELNEDYFDRITVKADPQLRLLHYPAIQRSEIERHGHSRINPHSDFGLCTLLFQDRVDGLEIDAAHTNNFIPAPPIEGTVLVNIGDLMQRLTNDRVKSTLHRVVNPTVVDESGMLPDRHSIAFFVHPDPDTIIEPIVREPGEVKKYEAVNAKAWRDDNTRRNYGFTGS